MPKAIRDGRVTKIVNNPVFRWWDYPIFALLTTVVMLALIYVLLYWFSLSDWANHPVTFVILTAVFVMNIGMYLLRWLSLPLMRKPRPVPARSGWKVGVATTFVPGAESLEMLEVTVRALVGMNYPHDTWVLDEGDDPQVKELCRRLGAYHFSRKGRPEYHAPAGTFESKSKHGNYNAWLYEIGFDRYEIIEAFDPDHVPVPCFLESMLGYFDDPEIGYVQAPQVYYNQNASFIARGAAEETYAYYSSIQMVAYALGYPIVTGCHNTHRVTALREVGGFAPHAADDLLITVMYRTHGWKGVYTPEILAKGLTPVDWHGYLTQQRRWARSVMDIKLRIYPRVGRELPLRERVLSTIHGLYYLQSVGTALQIALLIGMLATGYTPAIISVFTIWRLGVLYITMQACEFYRQRFYLDPRHEIGLHVRAGVLAFAKWPFILAAIYDCVTQHHLPYTITRKVKSNSRRAMLRGPHVGVVAAISISWVVGMMLGRIKNPLLTYSSAFILIASIMLLVTELLRYPEPFDRRLLSDDLVQREAEAESSD